MYKILKSCLLENPYHCLLYGQGTIDNSNNDYDNNNDNDNKIKNCMLFYRNASEPIAALVTHAAVKQVIGGDLSLYMLQDEAEDSCE